MTFGIILSSTAASYSYSQLSNIIMPGVKITFPFTGQQGPVGERTITGTSTDNAATDCTVYVDWNNTKPFQSWNFSKSQNVFHIFYGRSPAYLILCLYNQPLLL